MKAANAAEKRVSNAKAATNAKALENAKLKAEANKKARTIVETASTAPEEEAKTLENAILKAEANKKARTIVETAATAPEEEAIRKRVSNPAKIIQNKLEIKQNNLFTRKENNLVTIMSKPEYLLMPNKKDIIQIRTKNQNTSFKQNSILPRSETPIKNRII